MKIDSPYWNLTTGVCEKHGIPTVPCPQCLAEHDANLEVKVTQTDADVVAFSKGEVAFRDLLPAGPVGDHLMTWIC